jgi:uncharacterized membrane protein
VGRSETKLDEKNCRRSSRTGYILLHDQFLSRKYHLSEIVVTGSLNLIPGNEIKNRIFLLEDLETPNNIQ